MASIYSTMTVNGPARGPTVTIGLDDGAGHIGVFRAYVSDSALGPIHRTTVAPAANPTCAPIGSYGDHTFTAHALTNGGLVRPYTDTEQLEMDQVETGGTDADGGAATVEVVRFDLIGAAALPSSLFSGQTFVALGAHEGPSYAPPDDYLLHGGSRMANESHTWRTHHMWKFSTARSSLYPDLVHDYERTVRAAPLCSADASHARP